ncbi:RNA polymerase subunit sigma [Rhodococcus erythropolis]|uniref:RNA polymerase subunit sigma n=1 Tax=Rhodococcus erythropolis TaxID=1833 RepID=UPI001BE56333|nr:RNA polymerase subunit sigma [Rhodococcus erythropolis]MBT2265697.1 RNA polymerase subunit sigma [Rhodococcus erythropolis]
MTGRARGRSIDSVADDASRGDRDAIAELSQRIVPLVTRRCRAELRSPDADRVAVDICRSVLAGIRRRRHAGEAFLAHLYDAVSREIDSLPESSRLALPFGDLSADERNVLVARIVVGFDVRETALSLRTTTSAVELVQHRALAKIRRDCLSGA